MRTLIVEDETRVAEFIRKGLREAGHSADIAADGAEATELVNGNDYDMVLLDWLLPDVEGIQLCLSWRKAGVRLPVIMVTCRGATEDLTTALEQGADDHIVKPFKFAELLARMKALHRRAITAPESIVLVLGDLKVDPIRRKVERGGDPIFLSSREFALLEFLFQNLGKIVSKKDIARQVLGISHDTNTNIIEVHMNHLRNKLDCGSRRPLIYTIRGLGYVLKELDA